MATSNSRSPQESSFEVLLENVICRMCQSTYNDPKCLPCHHYYCKRCVEDEARKKGVIVCPKCNQVHSLSLEAIQALLHSEMPSEFHTLHTVLAEKVGRDGNSSCELCTSSSPIINPVQGYCYHCHKLICSFCLEAHRRYKIHAGHTVLRFADIPATGDSTSDTTPLSTLCMEHREELKAYCFDCCKLICRDCMMTEHKLHDCEFVKQAYEMIRKKLQSRKACLERSEKFLIQSQKKLDKALEDTEANGRDASEFVNRSFDIVLKQFEKYRSNLLQSIQASKDKDTREIMLNRKKLESAQKDVQSLQVFLQEEIDAKKESLLYTHHKTLERSKEVETLCEKRMEKATPQHNTSFEIYKTSCARIISAIGDSLKCADPIMCSLEGKGAKAALLDRRTKFHLQINQSNDTPCTALQNVHVELKSIVDSQLCETRTKIIKSNLCEVSYTPKVQGQHVLSVRVNERPIFNNPFTILVKKPLEEAKEPSMIIRGVKKIYDLDIHQNGSLIGTQYETGLVIKIDQKEKKMKKLFGKINQPYGVAANRTGWIFVTQNKKCSLLKFGKGSEMINTVGCKDSSLGNFNRPGRLAINKKGEIFVCDTKNSRVQVRLRVKCIM